MEYVTTKIPEPHSHAGRQNALRLTVGLHSVLASDLFGRQGLRQLGQNLDLTIVGSLSPPRRREILQLLLPT